MKQVEVVAAIIIHNNKILCVQRNLNKYDYISLKYEFPGGKIEIGESRETALLREIKEELNMEITILNEFLTSIHEYPDFKLTMHSFICTCKDNGLTLNEHLAFKWLAKDKISDLDWAEADISVVKKLLYSK